MGLLFLLFLIPLLVGGGCLLLYPTTFSKKEFLLQLFLSCTLITICFQMAKWKSLEDTEHWNGRILSKHHGTESCCHCRSVCDRRDSKGNCTSSHEECDHIFDYWWSVKVSTGDTLNDGCNGSSFTPSWWGKARIGDPASVEHGYQNYLRADSDSLFAHHTAHKKYLHDVPQGIPPVHDWFRVEKVIARGVSIPKGWNEGLQEINADLGKKKQVDLLVYLTNSADPTYADAVEEKWLYGPKNAVIVVLGIPEGRAIAWARVVSISKIEALKISLRDNLQGRALDDPEILSFLRKEVEEKFHRTPMEEFSYLASAAKPQGVWLFLLFLATIVISVGLAIWMHREDVFGDERWRGRHPF